MGRKWWRPEHEPAHKGVPGIVRILAGENHRETAAVSAEPLGGEVPVKCRDLDMAFAPLVVIGDSCPRTPRLRRIEETELFSALRDCMENRVVHHMENKFIYPDGSVGYFIPAFRIISWND